MRTPGALIAATAVLALAGARPAEAQVVATLGEDVPISSGHGWVVWSVRTDHGYGLTAWHGGVTASLDVAPRAHPFDVDVGTDAAGHDVVTFSRRGRVRVVDLLTGTETQPPIPHPPGTTDSSPSMWRGRVAFARSDHRHHAGVLQIELWRPGARHVRRLRHGTAPRDPTDVFTSVDGVDLGPRRLAFLWGVAGPGIIGSGGGQEIRIDRPAGNRTRLVASGYAGEVCNTGEDGFLLSAPALRAHDVWYMTTSTACYAQRSRVARYAVRTRRAFSGAIPGTLLRFTEDAGAVTVLTGQEQYQEPATCPCSLERRPAPPLTRREPPYRPPTY